MVNAKPETRHGIAVLVDWDNIRLRLEAQGIPLTAARLMALVRKEGNPVRCVVFADLARVSHVRCVELFSAGFVLVHCPRLPNKGRDSGKDTVDPAMVQEMHELCNRTDVDEVILASADRDFLLALSTLRNAAGKQVRILTATPTDRQALVAQSDGALAYAPDEESHGFAEEVARQFAAGVYDSTDPRHLAVLVGMTNIVAALHLRFVINDHRYSFNRLLELLMTVNSVRETCVTIEAVRDRLELLKDSGVLQQHTEGDDERTYYGIDAAHPFVRHVIPGEAAPTERSGDLPVDGIDLDLSSLLTEDERQTGDTAQG